MTQETKRDICNKSKYKCRKEGKDIFRFVLSDDKYIIAVGNQRVSEETFDTIEEAKHYIGCKTWELLFNTMAAIALTTFKVRKILGDD